MSESAPRVSRRNVVAGAVVAVGAGVAGYVVASNSDVAKAKPATSAANASGYGAPPSRQRIASVDDIPAGGGIVVGDAGVVVVRDQGGAVRGFSTTCTHQGCAVTDVRDGQILCPCHGSKFDIRTGAVTGGPARRPLPMVPVTVEGDSVYAG